MRDTAQQKFKTDSHLSQGCRKPRIRPECRMQGEIAVLIFTRTPAGCKSYKCIGRSSDLFQFYAFPALRPVAKIVKPFAPHVWGRNSQQRVLSQILTAFPFHSSSRNRRFGNLCDGKYTKTRPHTDGFQRNNAKCLDEKGISRFVPHSSF